MERRREKNVGKGEEKQFHMDTWMVLHGGGSCTAYLQLHERKISAHNVTCVLHVIVYPIWATSHRSFFTQAPDCEDMACRRVSVTTWAFCPIRARVSRLRGGPQGSRTSTGLDALPRSSPFRETITQ